MRVSKLRDETRSVAVKVEDETLTVEYRPNAYTPKLEQEAAQVSGDQAGPVLLTMLVPVIAGWDLVDDAWRDDPHRRGEPRRAACEPPGDGAEGGRR